MQSDLGPNDLPRAKGIMHMLIHHITRQYMLPVRQDSLTIGVGGHYLINSQKFVLTVGVDHDDKGKKFKVGVSRPGSLRTTWFKETRNGVGYERITGWIKARVDAQMRKVAEESGQALRDDAMQEAVAKLRQDLEVNPRNLSLDPGTGGVTVKAAFYGVNLEEVPHLVAKIRRLQAQKAWKP